MKITTYEELRTDLMSRRISIDGNELSENDKELVFVIISDFIKEKSSKVSSGKAI